MQSWHLLSQDVTLHLPMTLCGGQCFRWRKTVRGTWVGVVGCGAYELCEAINPPCNGCEEYFPAKEQTLVLFSASSHGNPFSKPALWFRCLHSMAKTCLNVDLEASFLRHYLALDVDLQQLWEEWTLRNPMREHPLVRYLTLNATQEPSVSIRLLRQELHETLLAFICSQNNNVQRITGLVEKLAVNCGRHICDYNTVTGEVKNHAGSVDDSKFKSKKVMRHKGHFGGFAEEWISLHCMPTVEELGRKTEEDLRALGFGYRSRYIIDCASIILASGVSKRPKDEIDTADSIAYSYKWYDDLLNSSLTLSRRREKLLSLPGVGRKVCDCVLLFAVGHHELVPVDTHMAQVAAEYLAQTATDRAASLKTGKKSSRKRTHEETLPLNKEAVGPLWWEDLLAEWYMKGKETKKNIPALLPKHHDAIQAAFQHLFGDWCGWAHSILFYARMRTGKQKNMSAPLQHGE